MLQANELGDSPRRVKGRWALERRARGLLLAVHRFGRCRATSQDDVLWTNRMADALHAGLEPGRGWPAVSSDRFADGENEE